MILYIHQEGEWHPQWPYYTERFQNFLFISTIRHEFSNIILIDKNARFDFVNWFYPLYILKMNMSVRIINKNLEIFKLSRQIYLNQLDHCALCGQW